MFIIFTQKITLVWYEAPTSTAMEESVWGHFHSIECPERQDIGIFTSFVLLRKKLCKVSATGFQFSKTVKIFLGCWFPTWVVFLQIKWTIHFSSFCCSWRILLKKENPTVDPKSCQKMLKSTIFRRILGNFGLYFYYWHTHKWRRWCLAAAAILFRITKENALLWPTTSCHPWVMPGSSCARISKGSPK